MTFLKDPLQQDPEVDLDWPLGDVSVSDTVKPVLMELMEPIYEEIRKLKWLMHHDVLTGLPNELSFQRRLVDREGGFFLVADLDGFKEYQDRKSSHRAGDMVIIEFAEFLRATVMDLRCPQTLFARLHGDEFMLWTPTQSTAEHLRDAIESWLNLDGGVTASAGLGTTMDTADVDMYQRKSGRKQRRFQQQCQAK